MVIGTLHCAEIFKLGHALEETRVPFFTLKSQQLHHHNIRLVQPQINILRQRQRRLNQMPRAKVKQKRKQNLRLRPMVAGEALVVQLWVYSLLQP